MSDGFMLVGVKACGCATAAMVDDEKTTEKDRREFYRECAKTRRTVERWTVERVRMELRRCKCAAPHGFAGGMDPRGDIL